MTTSIRAAFVETACRLERSRRSLSGCWGVREAMSATATSLAARGSRNRATSRTSVFFEPPLRQRASARANGRSQRRRAVWINFETCV